MGDVNTPFISPASSVCRNKDLKLRRVKKEVKVGFLRHARSSADPHDSDKLREKFAKSALFGVHVVINFYPAFHVPKREDFPQ